MAKDSPGAGSASTPKTPENSAENIASHDQYKVEDALYESERDALKKARESEPQGFDSDDGAHGYGNLHFGDQNIGDLKTFTPIETGLGGLPLAQASILANELTQQAALSPFSGSAPAITTSKGEGVSDVSVSAALAESGYEPAGYEADPIATGETAATVTLGANDISVRETTTDRPAVQKAPVNEAPTDIILSQPSVEENAEGAVVGVLSVVDPDANDTATFEIVGDAAEFFEIVGNELKLKPGVAFDFEDRNSFDVTINVTDSAGNVYQETVTVAVTDVNETPVDIQLSGFDINENAAGALVATLSATDEDIGDSAAFAIAEDPSGLFTVVGNELRLKPGASVDHEAQASFDITLTATDSGGNIYTETVTINAADLNENPEAITLSSSSISENDAGALIGTVSAFDPDDGDALTFAVSDERFEIVDGQLKLKDGVSLDHEAASEISVTVTATDRGGLSSSEDFVIDVADLNEKPGDIGLSGTAIAENDAGAVVGALSATDPDAGDSISFAVSDDRFEIVDGNLKLKDGVSLDHEDAGQLDVTVTATDAAGLSATETFSIDVTNVNESPASIGLSGNIVSENDAGAVVGELSAVDPDAGDSISFAVSDDRFEIVDGQLKLKDGVSLDHEAEPEISVNVTATDAGGLSTVQDFTIEVANSNEGPSLSLLSGSGLKASYYDVGHRLSNLDDVDFNAPPDAEGVVDSLNYMQGQEAFWEGAPRDYFAAKYEGQLVVEEGGSYTFSMASDDGSMLFINGEPVLDNDGLHGTRTRTVTVDLDEGSHDIEVRYFENGGAQTLQLAWAGPDTGGVTEVISGDSFEHGYALDNLSVSEDEPGAVIAQLAVTDPDGGDTHEFAVSDDRFEVVEQDGAYVVKLKDGESLDFETESNVDVTVTVTDAGGASDVMTLPIAVENSNDAPEISLSGGEGLKASYYDVGHRLSNLDDVDFNAPPDAEGVVDSLNYMQGQEAFWEGAPRDYFAAKYEGQLVVEEGGSYTFSMASDDGSMLFINGEPVLDNDGLHGTRTRTVTVDLDEGSHDIEVRYFENGGAQTLQLAWAGPDTGGVTEVISGDSYRLPGVDDASLLGVSENTEGDVAALLSITDPQNDAVEIMVSDDRFEVVESAEGYVLKLKDGAVVDHESESEISVTVTATDSHGESSSESFDIPVADLNEGPTAIELSGASVSETEEGAVVGTLSAADPDAGDSISFAVSDDRFEVVDGNLKLKDGVSLDHEAESDVSITVTATDSGGLSTTQTFAIGVSDVNEAPVGFNVEPVSKGGVLSLNQDGGNDDVATAANLEGFPTDALTVEVRFASDQADVGNGTPLFSYAADDGSNNEALIWLEGSSGNMTIFLAGQKINTGVPNASLLDGEEHQVSFTWDQSTNELKVYVDGEPVFDTSVNIRDLKSDGTMTLGQEQDAEGGRFDTSQIFEGEISEVRIFDYARSDEEVSDNADAPLGDPETEPGLINNWVMNEANDGVVEDLAGGDDLVLQNGAAIEGGGSFETPTVIENAPGAVAGVLSATDPQTGGPVTEFAIADDPSGMFEIVGNELKLKDGESLDYEEQSTLDITVTATGSEGASASKTITINVDDVNESPVVGAVGLGAVNEDTSVVITQTQLLAQSVDPEGAELEVTDLAVDPAYGSVVDNGDGTWTFKPTTDLAAEGVEFSYQVSDGTHSAPVSAVIDITAVADAPTLTIGSVQQVELGVTNTVSSGFEGGAIDTSASSSAWIGSVGDWRTTSDAIEIKQETLADGSSNQFIELNDDRIDYYDDASNINRIIDTQDGATYTIDFEYAPRPGYDASVNEIEVVVNDEVVETISADGTGDTGINWQSHSFTFTGDGSEMTVEFRASGEAQNYGRGMYMDDISITEELPAGIASGNDGEPIILPDISVSSNDADGSEVLATAISDVPDGFVLSDGANSFTAETGVNEVDVTNWALDQLSVTPAEGFEGEVNLTITATSTDGHSRVQTSDTITIDVQSNDDVITGTDKLDILDGGSGDDMLSGLAGNDILIGGAGNDVMQGGDGSDVFVYAVGDGSDRINGGAGDGWTDVIQLEDGAMPLGEFGSDWTISLTEGSIVSSDENGVVFSDDASGVIEFNDGSTLNFADIEQVSF